MNNQNSAYELSRIQEVENNQNIEIVGGHNFENWKCEKCTRINYKVNGNYELQTVVINWKTDEITKEE